MSFVMQEGKWCVAPCFAFITALSHKGAHTHTDSPATDILTCITTDSFLLFILTVIHSLPRTLPPATSQLWVAHFNIQRLRNTTSFLSSHCQGVTCYYCTAFAWATISLWKQPRIDKTSTLPRVWIYTFIPLTSTDRFSLRC